MDRPENLDAVLVGADLQASLFDGRELGLFLCLAHKLALALLFLALLAPLCGLHGPLCCLPPHNESATERNVVVRVKTTGFQSFPKLSALRAFPNGSPGQGFRPSAPRRSN